MKIKGSIAVHFNSKAKTLRGAVDSFKKKYPNAEIITIDGMEHDGLCDSCGLPILGDDWFGVGLCSQCGPELKEGD